MEKHRSLATDQFIGDPSQSKACLACFKDVFHLARDTGAFLFSIIFLSFCLLKKNFVVASG